jgi:PPOX class probable F420-dependent enzyme
MWERERYIDLVTYRRDGSEVETPVWFAEMAGRYYVFSEGDSYKVKRLRRNPAVRAAPCRMFGTVTGAWVSGRGRIVTDDESLVARAEQAFDAKYGWQIRAFNALSKLAGKYPKRAWLELTF